MSEPLSYIFPKFEKPRKTEYSTAILKYHHFKILSERKGADPISIAEIMTEQFGAKEQNGLFYFDTAKTLVLYCNGMWCGQSPNNIKSLLKYGYPADKIKWYRGGMQNWEILGFNTVK